MIGDGSYDQDLNSTTTSAEDVFTEKLQSEALGFCRGALSHAVLANLYGSCHIYRNDSLLYCLFINTSSQQQCKPDDLPDSISPEHFGAFLRVSLNVYEKQSITRQNFEDFIHLYGPRKGSVKRACAVLSQNGVLASWFHGELNRFEAEKLLSSKDNLADGTFIVRISTKRPRKFVVTRWSKHRNSFCHYEIIRTSEGYQIRGGKTYDTVVAFVQSAQDSKKLTKTVRSSACDRFLAIANASIGKTKHATATSYNDAVLAGSPLFDLLETDSDSYQPMRSGDIMKEMWGPEKLSEPPEYFPYAPEPAAGGYAGAGAVQDGQDTSAARETAHLATDLARKGLFEQAATLFEASLRFSRGENNEEAEATTLASLGSVYGQLRRFDKAISSFESSIAKLRSISHELLLRGDPLAAKPLLRTEWQVLNSFRLCCVSAERYDLAVECCTELIQWCPESEQEILQQLTEWRDDMKRKAAAMHMSGVQADYSATNVETNRHVLPTSHGTITTGGDAPGFNNGYFQG